jgi:hypothetical protein
MDDLGLASDGPVPVAEDNAVTRIIAHTGKLTSNVHHIALKTISLQTLVQECIAPFCGLAQPTIMPITSLKHYPFLLIALTVANL